MFPPVRLRTKTVPSSFICVVFIIASWLQRRQGNNFPAPSNHWIISYFGYLAPETTAVIKVWIQSLWNGGFALFLYPNVFQRLIKMKLIWVFIPPASTHSLQWLLFSLFWQYVITSLNPDFALSLLEHSQSRWCFDMVCQIFSWIVIYMKYEIWNIEVSFRK